MLCYRGIEHVAYEESKTCDMGHELSLFQRNKLYAICIHIYIYDNITWKTDKILTFIISVFTLWAFISDDLALDISGCIIYALHCL